MSWDRPTKYSLDDLYVKGSSDIQEATKSFELTRVCEVLDGHYLNIDTLPAVGELGKAGFVSIRDFILANAGGGGNFYDINVRAIFEQPNVSGDEIWGERNTSIYVNFATKKIELNTTNANESINSYEYTIVSGTIPDSYNNLICPYVELYLDGRYIDTVKARQGGAEEPDNAVFYLIDARNTPTVDLTNGLKALDGIGYQGQVLDIKFKLKG